MSEPSNVKKTAAVEGAAPCSASVVRRDLEEIRIECDVDDQDWIKAEMERLTADRWEVIHFGCPKLNPMKYSTRIVLIAVRSRPNATSAPAGANEQKNKDHEK